MTIEPAPPKEDGWKQVKSTPKRGGSGMKDDDQERTEMKAEKWRAEFMVNRHDRGKQWLVDIAMTNLMTVFFAQDRNTKIICRNKTEIVNTETLKTEINKSVANVLQTTETNNRKIVVFVIHYPPGLHAAKRDMIIMQHLKENKVFLNKHTTTEMIFEQVGFFIELDPATTFRPNIERELHMKICRHITDHPNDGRDAFAPKDSETKIPYFELRKGIEAQEHKIHEEDEEKILVKSEVLQVWTEAGSAEKLRMLLSKIDLRYSFLGQFIPKKRGTKLYSVEKYINAIQKQIKYKSDISSIMIQYLAEDAMMADVNGIHLDGDIEPLDTHILAIPNVLRIEFTNETSTKGKWLIVCKKEHREDIRTRLINNITGYYRQSAVYEEVATRFHSPVPVVAPPRYDYARYVDQIIPESMILGVENSTSTTNINKRRRTTKIGKVKNPPITTITTTAKQETGTAGTPYLNAAKGNITNNERTDNNKNKNDRSTSLGSANGSLKSNDTALSALTSKVDSLASQLTAARREIQDSKNIIAALLKDNKEMKERQQKADEINSQTQLMFQQLMMSMHPHAMRTITNNNPPHPQQENMMTTPDKYPALSSLQQATHNEIKNPPNIKPTKLKFGLKGSLNDDPDDENEIVFLAKGNMENERMEEREEGKTTTSASPSYGLEDER